MPHPRINPAVKGEYVKVGDYPGRAKAMPNGRVVQECAGWIKLSDIVQVVKQGQGNKELRFVLRGKPAHVYRGKRPEEIEANLKGKGVDVR